MRRITMWFIATVVVVVLLFSYRTSLGGRVATGGTGLAGGTDGGTGAGANPPGVVIQPTTGPSGQPSTPATGGATTGGGTTGGGQNTVVNGTVAQTRWGPVQVQVTIKAGRIVDVTALQVPNGNFRDQEINSYAVPQLNQEVLSAQSAHIDTVSGATVTSDGYLESLQAALDAAHFRA